MARPNQVQKKSKRKKKKKEGGEEEAGGAGVGGARNDGQTERERGTKRGSTELNTDGEEIINNKNIAFCSK